VVGLNRRMARAARVDGEYECGVPMVALIAQVRSRMRLDAMLNRSAVEAYQLHRDPDEALLGAGT
jgi:hypothetical protein